ncbi:MAG: glutamate synthase [Eubacteriaceae bacterium]
MTINGKRLHFSELNQRIKETETNEVIVNEVVGQRYIGTGVKGKEIVIHGTPGNALGAYLSQCKIRVYGNVQDAVGDTMNDGEIIIHGNCGDTLGYAMRGGAIYVKGNGGYRVGIHMKSYEDQVPVIVIGGEVGSFLGEYQAGGTIVVLGLKTKGEFPTGSYCGTGMHGGQMYIRSDTPPKYLPPQVLAEECSEKELNEIMDLIENYGKYFKIDKEAILNKPFYKLSPGDMNPYHDLYTSNE